MRKAIPFLVAVVFLAALVAWFTGHSRVRRTPQPAETELAQQKRLTPNPNAAVAATAQVRQSPTNQVVQPMADAELKAYEEQAITQQATRNAEVEKSWKIG